MDGNFEKFFRGLLLSTKSCLDRDVLRNCKDLIKKEYIRLWNLSPEESDDIVRRVGEE